MDFCTLKNGLAIRFTQKNHLECVSTVIMMLYLGLTKWKVKCFDVQWVLKISKFTWILSASLPAVRPVALGVRLQKFQAAKVMTADSRICCSDYCTMLFAFIIYSFLCSSRRIINSCGTCHNFKRMILTKYEYVCVRWGWTGVVPKELSLAFINTR